MFLSCRSRTEFGLPESEACFLQGVGQRRLRGLAVEKERCEGLLFSEVEEVLVCSEGQLPVLVHQRGGESLSILVLVIFQSPNSELCVASFPKCVTYFIVLKKMECRGRKTNDEIEHNLFWM